MEWELEECACDNDRPHVDIVGSDGTRWTVVSILNGTAVLDWMAGEERMSFDKAEELKAELPGFGLPRRSPPSTEEDIAVVATKLAKFPPGKAQAILEDAVMLKEINREDADGILEVMHIAFERGYLQPPAADHPPPVM